MRQSVVTELQRMLAAHGDVYLLTADTGFHALDTLRESFPDRVINVGIAEAGMIGMASGLAYMGKQVFCYGIAPFVTLRCLEQIRVDVCYPKLPVRIIGVGAGLTYGPAGMTHHAIEDIAIMRALPNMTVICPGDSHEAKAVMEAMGELAGPCYIRIGKAGDPCVHRGVLDRFEIGKGIRMRGGKGTAVISTGSMLETAVAVCELLRGRKKDPALISMHTVKPLDRDLLVELAGKCGTFVTIEEHSRIGGLGSAVAELIVDAGLGVSLKRFALPDAYANRAGSQEYWREQCGLSPKQIAAQLET